MKKIIIILTISIITIGKIFAQHHTDANIIGHILDSQTQEHLSYVTIGIKGTSLGTVSDASGHYGMKNLPLGHYTLVAMSVGYKTQEKEILIEKGKTIEINFELEEDAILLDHIVVSANKNETNRKEAVSIVNVITPKTFESTSSVCLAEGLNFQPGLRVENNCQNCGFSQLRINGLDGPYTQILMDSRAINSALAGVYGLEHIPVNMVERVEIVRGGASALFGASAVGGTVNIITREPTANSLTVSNTSTLIYGKTPDINTNLNASLVSNNNKAGMTLFAAARQRSPFDYDKDGFSEIPKLNSKSIGLRGFYRIGHTSKLTLEYHTIDEFRRGGNLFERPPHEADIAEQLNHNIHSGGLKYDIFFKENKHALQLYASLQHVKRESYYGAGKDPDAYGNTRDMSVVGGIQYTLRMKKLWLMPATFIAGSEYSYNRLHDRMPGYGRELDQKVDIISLYAQNEWSNKKATLLIGARMDKHNMIKNPIVNPRLSARYAPVSWLNLRAGYASGYRGPQAFDEDLHINAVGGAVSLIHIDPNLKPEKSHSLNLSAEFSKNFGKSGFLFLLEGFYTNLLNVFILEESGRDDAGNLLLERRNGSGAMVGGLNIEANIIPLRSFQINLGFTAQISRYKEPEQWSESVAPQRKMFRSPSTYGYITAFYSPVKALELSLSGTYTGSMLVQHYQGFIDADTEVVTQPFFDLGFKVAYDFNLKENVSLQLNIGMKNIFNSYQKDFDQGENRDAGYIYGPSLPRSVYAGIKFMI